MAAKVVACAFLVTGLCRAFTPHRVPSRRVTHVALRAVEPTDADIVRQKLASVEAEYQAKQAREARAAALESGEEVPALGSLELHPLVDEDGYVVPYEVPSRTRASIFAIFNRAEELVYVGITRNAAESFRQILGRKPQDAYGYRIHNLEKPARAVLELMRDAWIEANGAVPDGNRNRDAEKEWDSATDVQLLMSAEERAFVEEQRKMDKLGPALRKVARVYEAEKVAQLEARGIKTPFRFDPKLKLIGLLDLK